MPDMNYEQKGKFFWNTQYDGQSIYVWNIDGMSKFQICDVLHEMLMAANAYEANDNTDHQVVKLIIIGFTGILKNWWENCLNPESREKK